MARPSVVVIGGGLSALAAAWELSGGVEGPRKNTPSIEIIESAEGLGGAVGTMEFAGRIVDTGADGFLARRPEAVNLITEIGAADQLIPIAHSGAWLFLNGHCVAIPEGTNLGVPTSLASVRGVRELSWRAQWAARRDYYWPRRLTVDTDASIGAIVRAKLGNELTDRVIEPMIGGIQAGRVDDLSASAVFPALFAAARTGGSLMKALAPLPTAGPSSAPLFCSLREGVGSLPTLLATRLLERGVRIRTSTPVTAIRPTPAGSHAYEVDTATTTTPANYVVLACPPQVTGALVAFLGEPSDELRRLPSASAAMITLCVPRGSTRLPATGTGVLVPLKTPWRNGDSFLITALTFLDRKWPHLARDEDVLLRVHVGRIDDRRGLEMSDDELVARVREELAVIVGAWPHEGESVVVRWHDALPQYLVGHHDLVERARAASEARGIFLAGKTYDGVGIPASIGSGRRAGREILSRLAD